VSGAKSNGASVFEKAQYHSMLSVSLVPRETLRFLCVLCVSAVKMGTRTFYNRRGAENAKEAQRNPNRRNLWIMLCFGRNSKDHT